MGNEKERGFYSKAAKDTVGAMHESQCDKNVAPVVDQIISTKLTQIG
jgi:hypothetical protein